MCILGKYCEIDTFSDSPHVYLDSTSFPVWIPTSAFEDGWTLCQEGLGEESGDLMAPPRELSMPRALKVNQKKQKKKMVAKLVLFLRFCTIFCMREAVYISYASRILPAPLGPQNALKTSIYFLHLYNFCFGGLLSIAHLGYGYTSSAGAIRLIKRPMLTHSCR